MTRQKIDCILAKLLETSCVLVSYVGPMDYESFKNDEKTQDAAMMRLVSIAQLIAELISIAPDFIRDNPQIPWNQIRGMRNKIAHEYFAIDVQILFETAKNSVPEFIDMIDELIKSHADTP